MNSAILLNEFVENFFVVCREFVENSFFKRFLLLSHLYI